MSMLRPRLTRQDVMLRVFFVGLFTLGSSAFFLRDSIRLMRRGEHGQGTVIAVESRGSGRHRRQVAVVRVWGPTTSGQCEMAARRDHTIGVTLPMVFLPERPSVCRVDRLPQLLGIPGFGFAFGAVLVLVTLTLYERERRKLR
ncbi:DUF3592 domain-containing protein [Sandaracinus amylolyticus]|uniref:DUF3592 domain-containing protein n=1 Tax=Sandaracinus amylolyticus TaxID=927083 RepID=UPI001F15C07F|nr:DUF3592 domain-containing protein [Sandaracinus amylolyticus]UJR78499.1 Hypothetical protein I5071_5290 [Sandaracinus amylolyticus]